MKLKKNYFTKDAETIAKGLLGRYLVSELPSGRKIKIRLTEIAAYEGETKTTYKGASYAPGKISISTKFGQILIDIATGKENNVSCITLRGGEVDLEGRMEPIKGPGKLTQILGITKSNKEFYDGANIYDNRIWIEGKPIDESQIKKLKCNSPNCKGIYKF